MSQRAPFTEPLEHRLLLTNNVTLDNTALTVDEGGTIGNTGTFAGTELTANHGSITDNKDGTWSWSHTVGNGDSTLTVDVTADDGAGGNPPVTQSFSVTINDVAPTITVDPGTSRLPRVKRVSSRAR